MYEVFSEKLKLADEPASCKDENWHELHEWIKFSEGGDFNKYISTVASLKNVDFKPFYNWLLLAEFVFANHAHTETLLQQRICSKQICERCERT